MHKNLPCFKAYDIRGRIPDEFNEDLAYKIGLAYANYFQAKRVVVGYDIRHSSKAITKALCCGLNQGGTKVIDIGLCGTEMVYFATFSLKNTGVDGGLMVTASHNPIDYNGIKMVKEAAKPINGDTGLEQIKNLILKNQLYRDNAATITHKDIMTDYIDHLLSYIDVESLKPLHIATNAGNGAAGLIIDQLKKHLPFKFSCINHNPDGDFPSGIPNPLLPEKRQDTADLVKRSKADFGIAFDGDYDRCFFFDENGQFIEGYYLVGLLAKFFLQKMPGQKIIYDPRLTWNTIKTAKDFNSTAVVSKSGHTFIKEAMRKHDAIYGGEMSAHHYFRNFAYCDSGMIPWLIIAQIISQQNKSLGQLTSEFISNFPSSGEINLSLNNPDKTIDKIKDCFSPKASAVSEIDGLSCEFKSWRFNIRKSNTENLLRLNIETKQDKKLLQEKTQLLIEQIRQFSSME